jgi:xanthine/CO dehydrogenase XdhC/CoxF family maturation factor
MDILLSRVSDADGWQPMPYLVEAFRRGEPCRLGFVVASEAPGIDLGLAFPVDGQAAASAQSDARVRALHAAATSAAPNSIVRADSPPVEIFVGAFAPPPRLLMLGGGPDARPVATLAAFLGWQLTVVDHRSTYLSPARFPSSTTLIESRAENVASVLKLDEHAAAIVMSHHLDSDLQYLRALAASSVPYVGLLGPAARREKLLADLGVDAAALRTRLRAPVGLDIGGRTPESIALSIIGEVHAALAGRAGRPFSETSMSDPGAR